MILFSSFSRFSMVLSRLLIFVGLVGLRFNVTIVEERKKNHRLSPKLAMFWNTRLAGQTNTCMAFVSSTSTLGLGTRVSFITLYSSLISRWIQ